MTPRQLETFLAAIIEAELRAAVMIWGPPGVGKSSIVAEVARAAEMEIVDLRLSQLAPTDLRGLPVAEDGTSHWYPPEFLPRNGRGVLFLDEVNMAPPTLQGVAQQLILDRRVGSYVLPPGWFVWAAGNRKEDRAAVFDMPAPLANRFMHLEVHTDLSSWRSWAYDKGLPESVVAFVSYRPALLHALDADSPAWPSPRSWEVAGALTAAGLPVAPAIGETAAAEFEAFTATLDRLPDIEAVLSGSDDPTLPSEPSVRYAAVTALAVRASTPEYAARAIAWVNREGGPEWMNLLATQLVERLQRSGELGLLAEMIACDPALAEVVRGFGDLVQ